MPAVGLIQPLLNLSYRPNQLIGEARELIGFLQKGHRLDPVQAGNAQHLLNQVGQRPVPPEVVALLGRNVVIPHLTGEGLQTYAQAVVPNTVEVLFHPNIHGSMRVGNTWFDFTNNDAWTEIAGTTRKIATEGRVGRILGKYPNGAGQQGGIGVLYFAPSSTINALRKKLMAEVATLRLPSRGQGWSSTDPNAHTCLSAATSLLAKHCPELGIPTIWGPEFFPINLVRPCRPQKTTQGWWLTRLAATESLVLQRLVAIREQRW